MSEKMNGIVNKARVSPFIQAALTDVQPFEQQDAIQRKFDEMKNHIRYINPCGCDLLAEINVKYGHNNSYIIQIYESTTLKG